MTRIALAMVAAGVVAAAGGCDDKKAPVTGTGGMGDKVKQGAGSMGDAVKSATSDAAGKMGDAAGKVGGAMDAARTKIGDEVRSMVDAAKVRIDALSKGGSTVAADKRTDYDKSMTEINGQYRSFSEGVASLKDQAGEAFTKRVGDLKAAGGKLMDSIKAAGEKYGIKA